MADRSFGRLLSSFSASMIQGKNRCCPPPHSEREFKGAQLLYKGEAWLLQVPEKLGAPAKELVSWFQVLARTLPHQRTNASSPSPCGTSRVLFGCHVHFLPTPCHALGPLPHGRHGRMNFTRRRATVSPGSAEGKRGGVLRAFVSGASAISLVFTA